MKLKDYLQQHQITEIEFAALVGRSRWAVRKWKYGQRVPRANELLAISSATNGAVTPNDFLPSTHKAQA